MSMKLRIGAVSFLNTVPLVYGMQHGLGADRIDLSFGVPSNLAKRMRNRELDVALLPIIELASMPAHEIVPGLAIATQGKSASVLMISQRPVEVIRSVALDRESRTSNVLARVLFARHWKTTPEFSTGESGLAESLATHDAVIRIGDKALYEPVPADAIVYDLGEIWTASTGLPFVFAAWVAWPGKVDSEISQLLHSSYQQGSQHIKEIAARHTWRGKQRPERARTYLTEHIQYRLGTQELKAIRMFFEAACELGLIDTVPTITLSSAPDQQATDHEITASGGAT
jgi:chorismate dehydratase